MTSKTARLTLAAALAVGGIVAAGLGGPARAEAQVQPGAAAALLVAFQQFVAAPSFVYGHGAQGFGYYAAPAQQARAAAAPRASSGTAPRRPREFGTGRCVNLAKPWLNQFR